MLRSRISVAVHRRALVASPRPSSVLVPRAYSTPSTPRAKPVAAAAQTSTQFDPAITYSSTPKAEPEPHRFNTPFDFNLHSPSPSFVTLPSPLPSDVAPPPGSLQSELYQTTSNVDTISILSICVSRPEFVPRAYNIFINLIEQVKRGESRNPDAKIWASVVKAIQKLGAPNVADAQAANAAALWRTRAGQIVGNWEALNNWTAGKRTEAIRAPSGTPAVKRQGLLIYRAWFAGIIETEAPLDPILPYISHPDVGLENLTEGFSQEQLDSALAQVEKLATDLHRQDILEQINALRSVQHDKQAFEERERKALQVPEVNPILEKEGSDPDAPEVSSSPSIPIVKRARFAIRNLRQNLKQINTPLTSFNRQLALEKASYEAAEEELKHAARQLEEAGVEDNSKINRNGLQAHMHRWHVELTKYLTEDIARLRQEAQTATGSEVKPPMWTSTTGIKDSTLLLYLSVLPEKKLALVTVLEMMRLIGSGGIIDGMKTTRGCIDVGRAVESEHRADTIRSVAGPASPTWQRTMNRHTHKPNRVNIKKVWADIGRTREAVEMPSAETGDVGVAPHGRSTAVHGEDLRGVWTPPWSQMVQTAVGSYLIDALIRVAKVTRYGTDHTGAPVSEDQNAFSHSYEYLRGRRLGVIRLNPAIAERLASDSVRQVIHPKHLPMLVPPRPWSKWDDGAYLSTPVQTMRFKDSVEQRNYLREASNQGHLDAVFHGLDVISSTPWAINHGVFDVVLESWNKGEAIADIPAAPEKSGPDLALPDKPDAHCNDPIARNDWVGRVRTINKEQRKNHAERCKYNYNLEIARSYLNDIFYIPHNMDFRGRAYPIPPHLSPVGDDLCRGLLTFGVKKPLGNDGLRWLRIHLANVFGYDKASFSQREQFAIDHEADVFDSADNPLTGKRWWLESENPWQTLAACKELTGALRSADPTMFESSLPIHQDGTCNGMQHYAALGGDVAGAKAVNLEKGDRPSDVYTGVADLVNASIAEDKKNGDPVAVLIDLPLGRKIVKQTVMTTVYGVTFVGAREQIAKQLEARGGMDRDALFRASAYIARKVFDSIGNLFGGARAIQDWLTISARLIARSIPPERLDAAVTPDAKKKGKGPHGRLPKELMTSVVWTSPLGLPVVQPYRKEVKKQVLTSLQTVYIRDPNLPSEVSPNKQATAFPPNYIHSLDATHMLMTATRCNQNDVTFASVHDSYWTHASTVQEMSNTLRDTFIHLHSQNLVGELREEFLHRYGDNWVAINQSHFLLREAQKQRKAGRSSKASEKQAEDSAVDVLADEPLETDLAEAVDAEALEDEPELAPTDLGINEDELSDDIPIVRIRGSRFVRFRDILPPTPPRGTFDVERIRDSEYFFS